MGHTHKRGRLLFLFAVIAIVAGLFRPDLAPDVQGASAEPFAWDRDELFDALENDFAASRTADANILVTEIDEALELLDSDEFPVEPLSRLEHLQFRLAATAAAEPTHLSIMQSTVYDVRRKVLAAAASWRTSEREVHSRIYRVLYGGRAAREEALIQAGDSSSSASLPGVFSETPSAEVHHVRVHSGDVVLTRGGAPTSALIARGNDFPGNFSHAALIHVDEAGTASVIESLIEHGLVVSTLEDFLRDKKLRILLLRPRPTLDALAEDPMAPHRAATTWLARARSGDLGYDFAMDWSDDDDVFCSEVVYHAYREVGVELWRYRSTISSRGLVTWLGLLGVRNFVTLVPSDLEYDPQLALVAEWHDPEELRRDRRDNAIVDALLEEADRGATLGYAWYELPAARALKAWSLVVSFFGGTPTIPDGMSGATAARVNGLRQQIFAPLRVAVEKAEASFRDQHGYEAPYWQLVPLAREAIARHRDAMAPALSPKPE